MTKFVPGSTVVQPHPQAAHPARTAIATVTPLRRSRGTKSTIDPPAKGGQPDAVPCPSARAPGPPAHAPGPGRNAARYPDPGEIIFFCGSQNLHESTWNGV